MIEIFEKFGELLNERFRRGVVTTEDSVRYTFFAALLDAGVTPHEVVLEYPHPAIYGAKIDTWLPSYKDRSIALEFKYDRDLPGGKNQPKTQKAGYIFKDLHRQVLVAKEIGVRSFFVYVTSEEMAVYFRNPDNGYAEFWGLQNGKEIDIDNHYLSNKPKTFLNTLGGMFQAKVMGIFNRTLSGGNYLRVYEVMPSERQSGSRGS
ncbi:MAG: hypothetical protein JRH08_15300 [Deltaproteobacteria bacterium]|nr:hypothetical protein [Deltaproteobacteria bacterium]MBW1931323.1 hypothetical protein [Deltaproteobacteria bacterium]MBW2026918.1 hypothetical protein [Deltaproteobacteria bacterium]MBW2126996.1 hypothetical protein [Deltaproteobacteria bacterium]